MGQWFVSSFSKILLSICGVFDISAGHPVTARLRLSIVPTENGFIQLVSLQAEMQ